MYSIGQLVESLCAVILLVVVSTFIGYLFEKTVKTFYKNNNNIILPFFWKIFIGTSLILSIYAILVTKAITILLLLPFLLFFLTKSLLSTYSSCLNSKKIFYRQYLFAAVSLIFNFIFYNWALSGVEINNIKFVSGDFNIYYRIAQRLNQFGIESLNLDPIYAAKYASPYHYGDVWLYALTSKFINTNPTIVFLISFSFLSTIFINAVYNYISYRFDISGNYKYVFIFLLAGLFTGFSVFFPKFILSSAEPYTLSVMNWSKVLTPSYFLIAMLGLAYQKNWKSMVYVAMIGGLSFINAMPALFMTLFFILLVAFIRKQLTRKQWFFYNLVYVLITAFFILFIYKILPNFIGLQPKEQTGVQLSKGLDFKLYFSTAIKIFIGGWFQLFVLLPFILVVFISIISNGKLSTLKAKLFNMEYDLLFMFFALLSGLSCWAILHPFAPDAVQFYTNIIAPVYTVVISYIIGYQVFVSKQKLLKWITIGLVLTTVGLHKNEIFFVRNANKNEWNKLKSWVSGKQAGHYFANLRPSNHFNSFFDKNTVYFMPLGQLIYIWPNYHNFSLNAPFLKENVNSIYATEEKKELELAPFSIYLKQLRKSQKDISFENAMMNFIQMQKIGYISISKDTTLPQIFRNLIKDSIELQSENLIVYQIR